MASELVRQLLEAGVHFGHQTKRWNPKMKPFIFGARSGIYIIDREKTERYLQVACEFLEGMAGKGERVLFVGTKKQAKPILQDAAQRTEMPFVVNRWLGGTLTNFETIKKNISRLRELRVEHEQGLFDKTSKKEARRLTRQLGKLESHFSGLVSMERLPGCLFVVDTKREDIAIREANRLSIPVVAICDTNADPDRVNYPIPGNDDAIRSIRLMVSMAVESVLTGRSRHGIEQQRAAAAAEDAAAKAAVAVPAEGDALQENGNRQGAS